MIHREDHQKAAEVIAAARWYSGDRGLIDAMLSEGTLAKLAAGRWTHGEGDDLTGLLIVIEGAVDLSCQARGDRQAQLGQLGPGGALGQTVRFGGGTRLVTAVCAEDSLLLLLSDHALELIARTNPDIWRVVAAVLYHQLRASLRLATDHLVLAPRARLASRLHSMARTRSEGARLTLTQAALAEMTGVTRKTANAILRELSRRGAIRLGYGWIEVVDLALLDDIAEA